MKKLIYGTLFLALVGIGLVGCKKENIVNSESVSNQSKTANVSMVSKSSNFVNPYEHVGQNLYSLLEYLETFADEIGDSSVYCPIEYSLSQTKVFATKTKMLNRIKEFGRINNLPTLNDETLSNIYDSYDGSNPTQKLSILADSGEISLTLKNVLIDMNNTFKTLSNTSDLIDATEEFELYISNSNLNLQVGELELLYSIVSGIKYTAMYMNNNGNTNLPSVVFLAAGGIPCGAAAAGYGASFVGLCMATGPVGWLVGGIGFGMSVWGVFDSCR
jgi:hypothetical protein